MWLLAFTAAAGRGTSGTWLMHVTIAVVFAAFAAAAVALLGEAQQAQGGAGLRGGDTSVHSTSIDQSAASHESRALLRSGWVRGAIWLVVGVPASLGVAVDRVLVGTSCRPLGWLTASLEDWHWAEVTAKAIWLQLAYVCLLVVGKSTLVLIAAARAAVGSVPVLVVSAAAFAAGFTIFMMPWSPALPVYIAMAVAMVDSASANGWQCSSALIWATTVTFAMKLTFTAAAQKWIGQPLGKSVWVRRTAQVHTPYMRAVEHILLGGPSLAKVAILVGGPDWPVSVLCGILRLPLGGVLVCVSPVLVQSVLPSVLCGALLYWRQAGSCKGDPIIGALVPDGRWAAETLMASAGMLQFVCGLWALRSVQQTLEAEYDHLSEPRPEDELLRELDARDAAQDLEVRKLSEWCTMPTGSQGALAIAFGCAEASFLLFSGVISSLFGLTGCFREPDMAGSLDPPLRANPVALLRSAGWAAMGLSATAALGLAYFYSWRQKAVKEAARDGETAPFGAGVA